jgi:hypothetical protein
MCPGGRTLVAFVEYNPSSGYVRHSANFESSSQDGEIRLLAGFKVDTLLVCGPSLSDAHINYPFLSRIGRHIGDIQTHVQFISCVKLWLEEFEDMLKDHGLSESNVAASGETLEGAYSQLLREAITIG